MHDVKAVSFSTEICIPISVDITPSVQPPTDRGEYEEYCDAYHAWYMNEVKSAIRNLTPDQIKVGGAFLDTYNFRQQMSMESGSSSMRESDYPEDWKKEFMQKVEGCEQVQTAINHTHKPRVSCEVAVFDTSGDVPEILLIRRKWPPFQNTWALPGGFLEMDEELESCAQRELYEETGVDIDESDLLQVYAVGTIDRDPRDRIIAVVYTAVVEKSEHTLCAGDDAVDTAWFRIDALPILAADHRESMLKALGEVYHDRG